MLLVDGADDSQRPEGTLDLPALMRDASPAAPIVRTDGDDMALLHFTSGTTGMPKGAIHVHDAVVAHAATGRFALDLHPDDVYWCTADPGWVTGTSYGVIAPLVHGVTTIVDEDEFDAERWYRILAGAEGDRLVHRPHRAPNAHEGRKRARGSLRPVRPAVHRERGRAVEPRGVAWGVETYGRPIHDNWWQTETGGIMIANFAAMDIRPGSMGRPLPGVDAAIVRRDDQGDPVMTGDVERSSPSATLRASSHCGPAGHRCSAATSDDEERYRKCFVGGWYLTGDLATRDADGYFWFVGRGDDVIKSAGHLIGPFEVESALMEHPAVAEAGVIGMPDAVAGEVVKAFVALRPGCEPSEDAPTRDHRLRAQAARARPSLRGRWTSRTRCLRPGAGRSCAAC